MDCYLSTSLQLRTVNPGLSPRTFGVHVSQRPFAGWKCFRPCKVGGRILETAEKQDGYLVDTSISKEVHAISRLQQDGYAPLVTALKSTAESNAASFHFPGHNRGQAAPSSLTHLISHRPYFYDLPELPELDNLFSPEGPILDAQKQAAKVFGAAETWFLTGGTTCGIQAAIMATCSPGDTLILPRNSHISAISGMILSGAIPNYIVPEYDIDWEVAGPVTLSQIEEAINNVESGGLKIGAVLITSPTYYGICTNLDQISELCQSRDIPLIVDEAHGAHFGFHPLLPISALEQGADVVVQSTHKVLCSLTQSSMLHSSHNSLVERERISRCLQTLQSSSPSYLLLASLDGATAQLCSDPQRVFDKAIGLALEAKYKIRKIPGLSVLETTSNSNCFRTAIDPLRVVVGFWKLGISGYEADEFLYEKQGVVSELVGSRSVTFVFTPGTQEEHVKRLVLGLEHLSCSVFGSHQKTAELEEREVIEPFDDFEVKLSPREAFFSNMKKASVKESVGKISGELICPYPPGIPVMVPGEVITRRAVDYVLRVKREGAMISGASDPQLSSIVVCDM